MIQLRLFLCPSDSYSWRGPRLDAGQLEGMPVGQTNYTYQDPDWWPNTQSFRSVHPAGLNFAMVDGSTQFINQDIDLGPANQKLSHCCLSRNERRRSVAGG